LTFWDGGVSDAYPIGPVIGPDGAYLPAGARRVVDGVDTDLAADWVISDFGLGSANTPTAGTYAPSIVPSIVLNELLISTTSTDVEYIELYGAPGTSLFGLSVIGVEGDITATQGSIDFRYDFEECDAIGANGFFLIGNTLLEGSTYGVTPNATVGTNSLENSSSTYALVETSSLAGSSVTGSEVVLDEIGFTDGGAGDVFYFGAPVIGPDGAFFPAGGRRVTDGVDTDMASDWVISDFSLGPDNTPTAGDLGLCPGDLVITEIMQNPDAVGDNEGEWFEIYNTTDEDIDIQGLVISDNDSDVHTVGTSVIVPAGGYAVLGRNDNYFTNGYVIVDYRYGSAISLANGADEIVLTFNGIEIDRVEYDGGPNWPDPTGASMILDPDAIFADNNDPANWCTSTSLIDFNPPPQRPGEPVTGSSELGLGVVEGDLATPGEENDDCNPVICVEPGDLVITEIMQNPSAVFDSDGEWFEVYNSTEEPIDMGGFIIRDNDFDIHEIQGSLIVPAGGYVVLGNNDDMGTNGGVAVDYNYGNNWFLSNGLDEVIIECDGGIIDAVLYDGGLFFPDPNGNSMSLNPDFLNATDNDDGANWCENVVSTYGAGDYGTPGVANDICCSVPNVGIVVLHSQEVCPGEGGSISVDVLCFDEECPAFSISIDGGETFVPEEAEGFTVFTELPAGDYDIVISFENDPGCPTTIEDGTVTLVAGVDDTPPTITCAPITVEFNGEYEIELDPYALLTSYSDNCPPEDMPTDLWVEQGTVYCDELGQVLTVTLYAEDAHENVSEGCETTVTVDGLPCGWMTWDDHIDCPGSSADFDPELEEFYVTSADCSHLPYSPVDEEYAYVKTTLCGDGEIIAQVTDLDGLGKAWAGIVMRESNDPGSKKYQVMTGLDYLQHRVDWRSSTGGRIRRRTSAVSGNTGCASCGRGRSSGRTLRTMA
ncbi:MAG: lamin tail domain-containing protein, partial [Lewinella sp.]|nr:lamin tail domain-containing protein [Lewinella sp.]